MKDKLTLALYANVNGDCKMKTLIIYHSKNPRDFKSDKILKEKQVMWKANPRAWVTRRFFVGWVHLVLGLQENKLSLQAYLVLDNVC